MNKLAKILLVTILHILPFVANAQINNIDNIGFEKGNFDGWELSYGKAVLQNNVTTYQNEKIGTISNKHIIVSSFDGNDPKITRELLPVAYKNSKYSLRLGNTVEGGSFEKAKTSFTVSANHSLFQYHFMVLLQEDTNNRHTKAQKPGFAIQISDASGNNVACGDFDVQLDGNSLLGGFSSQGDIEYRNWTTGAIDLHAHIGKTLTVSILVHGCTQQKHFGYAYFDAELIKSQVIAASFCPDENGMMTFLAPEGFEKYVWSNGQSTRGIVDTPSLNQNYKVTMTPYSSLEDACSFSLDYKVPFKKIDSTINMKLCEGEHFKVENTIYSTTGNFNHLISRGGICDSTVKLNLLINKIPREFLTYNKCEGEIIKISDTTISTNGLYKIKISRTSKCDSIITAEVKFEKLQIELINKTQTITAGDEVQISAKTTEGIEGSASWQTSNSQLCNNCNSTLVSPSSKTSYFFEAKSQSNICVRRDTAIINVNPCGVHFPNVFSPNNDNNNDTFFGFGSTCISKILKFQIFNRWGEEIYYTENIPVSSKEDGWNGKRNGSDLPSGIYTYRTKAELKNGSIENYDGLVELLR